MTLLSTAQHLARDTRNNPRAHLLPLVVAAAITSAAIALVCYLLWPTWGIAPSSGPSRLPVSVGATLFNVPTGGGTHEDPAPLRTAGARRSRFRLSLAGGARGAETCQRRDGRRQGAADRPHLPVDRGASRFARARHPRAHDLSALSRSEFYAGRGWIDDARLPRRLALCRRRPVLGRGARASPRAARET